MWHGIQTALPDQRAAVPTGHIRFGTGFIKEDESLGFGESRGDLEVAAMGRNVGPILLAGSQRFFLSDRPSFLQARQTAITLQ